MKELENHGDQCLFVTNKGSDNNSAKSSCLCQIEIMCAYLGQQAITVSVTLPEVVTCPLALV